METLNFVIEKYKKNEREIVRKKESKRMKQPLEEKYSVCSNCVFSSMNFIE